MSDEKVKVFKLAKQYGFKSSEFVDVLAKIGFPVTSYQASVDAWDVPIIEERLLRGNLIDTAQATNIEIPEDQEEGVGWDVVVSTLTPQEDEEVEASPTAEPDSADEDSLPGDDSKETPDPGADDLTAGEATADSGDSEEEPATEQESGVLDEARAAPTPAAQSGSDEGDEATPVTPSNAVTPTAAPKTPKPRSGATRVGKIDLAALGLVKAAHQKGRGKVTFTDVRNRETSRRRDQRTRQRERLKSRKGMKKQVSTVARKGDVVLESPVTAKSFSTATGIAVSQLIGKLMGMGMMPNMNTELDTDTIELLAAEFEIGVRLKERADIEGALMAEIVAARKQVDDSDLAPRPPVVAFMGHVDHGKTSLIDAIRTTKVVDEEAGGITQHIGAYTVKSKSGQGITIIDTPGHAAFTAMRARGAQTTDIAILVVAADDGVMPQTEEAANHAREAGVPVIVVLNKIDVNGANPEKVKAELANIGLQSEDWGGEVGVIETSALRHTGIDDLLERIALESEVLELRAHPNGQAHGVVMEALVSEGKGKVAHLLIKDGTLKAGDVVLCGDAFGKIRRIYDHNGTVIKQAGPSTPVEVLGLNEMPSAGQKFYVVRDLKAAKEVAEKRAMLAREQELTRQNVSQEDFLEHIDASQLERLRLVVKADVGGSLEVLKSSLQAISNSEIVVEIVHSGVGAVTETDVILAATAGAIVVAFNVKPDSKARNAAEKERVEIMKCGVIYDLLEEIEKRVLGKMGPEYVEEETGAAEVLQLFKSSRWGTIAGSAVTEGVVRNSSTVRVFRDGKELTKNTLDSLRHVKDDVKEVKAGSECGIKVHDFDDIQVGDIIKAFDIREIAPTLDGETEKAEA
ncbi:MAG: translation initiation factor IF-2 [Planctomycetota bacterium]|nr:MAG: translation initiation factor IF-2 [Planctomycetota bacterium]